MTQKKADPVGAVLYLILAVAFLGVAALGIYYLSVPEYVSSPFVTIKMSGSALPLTKHEAAYGMLPLGVLAAVGLGWYGIRRMRGPVNSKPDAP